MTHPKRNLDSLRAQVSSADRALWRALEERLALAHRIGLVKQTAGLPLRDFTRERQVTERWLNHLAGLGIPPERSEALTRWVIEESVRIQEQLPAQAPRPGRGSDILIVGGAGAMGRWLSNLFESSGHRVLIIDLRLDRRPGRKTHSATSLKDRAARADIVVVATPMRAAPGVYRELLSSHTRAVIFDILSIKWPILPWIRKGIARGYRLTSTHPLFGPTARTLSGRNLLILDCGDAKASRVAESLFATTSLRITHLPVELHDELIADTLALPHLTSLLFALTLAQRKWPAERLLGAAPTSFLRQAEAARVITAENMVLSFDIQTLSPASRRLFARMERVLQGLRRSVEAEEYGDYQTLLRRASGALPAGTFPRPKRKSRTRR